MDALGLNTVVLQTIPAPASRQAGPVLPQPSQPALPMPGGPGQGSHDASVADQKRAAAIQQMAHDVANVYVVSDKTFTIFKDVTGQYITRFTSLRDGRVTYIPEPSLMKLSGGAPSVSLNIKA